MSDDDPLDSLADSILDDRPIDWSTLDERLQSDPALFAQLRTVATVKDWLRNSRGSPSLLTWGHLEIRERIGRGSFGEVYRAWDARLDREVALKLIAAEEASASGPPGAIEEGRLLARIRHPNVVTIYGAERIDGCIGLWMELVNGRTLEELISEGRRFTVKEATSIALEICSAVAAVHDAGLLHRDIKAHNVMLTGEGRTVLMDFGTGREATQAAGPIEAGTPLYLAPEVLAGCAASVRSDVYSVGVLLYRLLTGSYPVRASSVAALRRAHDGGARQGVRDVRGDVPSRLGQVVDRALDRDPLSRFEDARALAAALTKATRASRPLRAALAAAIAATLITGVWVWRGAPWPGRQPQSVALLPFQDVSSDADTGYLADGLAEEIIRNLSSVERLEVRSRASSLSPENRARDADDAGRQLAVDHVVHGTFERAGDRLRVNVQLIRVAGGAPLWSENFDRPIDQMFGLGDEIARRIARALHATYVERPSRRQPAADVYQLYLRARAEIEKGGPANASRGAAILQQVIDTDDQFAPAYASLVDAYWFMSTDLRTPVRPDVLLPGDALNRMRPLAQKALELDPLLPEAHSAMGMTYSRECDWANAQPVVRARARAGPVFDADLHQLFDLDTRSTWQIRRGRTAAEYRAAQ